MNNALLDYLEDEVRQEFYSTRYMEKQAAFLDGLSTDQLSEVEMATDLGIDVDELRERIIREDQMAKTAAAEQAAYQQAMNEYEKAQEQFFLFKMAAFDKHARTLARVSLAPKTKLGMATALITAGEIKSFDDVKRGMASIANFPSAHDGETRRGLTKEAFWGKVWNAFKGNVGKSFVPANMAQNIGDAAKTTKGYLRAGGGKSELLDDAGKVIGHGTSETAGGAGGRKIMRDNMKKAFENPEYLGNTLAKAVGPTTIGAAGLWGGSKLIGGGGGSAPPPPQYPQYYG